MVTTITDEKLSRLLFWESKETLIKMGVLDEFGNANFISENAKIVIEKIIKMGLPSLCCSVIDGWMISEVKPKEAFWFETDLLHSTTISNETVLFHGNKHFSIYNFQINGKTYFMDRN